MGWINLDGASAPRLGARRALRSERRPSRTEERPQTEKAGAWQPLSHELRLDWTSTSKPQLPGLESFGFRGEL